MKREHALNLLGLPDQAAPFTLGEVQAAFRLAVWKKHPDGQGEQINGMWADIDELKQARKLLILNLNGQNNACPQCRGRGYIPAKFGTRSCGACKGTGDKVG